MASAQHAVACSVCFGDPESKMVKGALAGVSVLVGVVACVLLGVTGTGVLWFHRGRKLARRQMMEPDPTAHRE
ncbi:MAG: hypothetical protein ACE5E6_01275 [Phycisphaerae bacterium]